MNEQQVNMMTEVIKVADKAYVNATKATGLALSSYRKAQLNYAHALKIAVANFERDMAAIDQP